MNNNIASENLLVKRGKHVLRKRRLRNFFMHVETLSEDDRLSS